LPGRHDVPGPAHRRGRIDRHYLTGHQPGFAGAFSLWS
jgi:hypothetical protein